MLDFYLTFFYYLLFLLCNKNKRKDKITKDDMLPFDSPFVTSSYFSATKTAFGNIRRANSSFLQLSLLMKYYQNHLTGGKQADIFARRTYPVTDNDGNPLAIMFQTSKETITIF